MLPRFDFTLSSFTKQAKQTAENNPKLALIDGDELVELMIENNLGVNTKSNYEKIDLDYFSE